MSPGPRAGAEGFPWPRAVPGATSRPVSPFPGVSLRDALPFSFLYEGIRSDDLLKKFDMSRSRKPIDGGTETEVTFTSQQNPLSITWQIKHFHNHRAVEWVLWIRNTHGGDSGMIERLLPLDVPIELDRQERPTLHYNKGSLVGPLNDDYAPLTKTLGDSDAIEFPPRGKIVSQAYLPYFNLQTSSGGIIGAIGWTGQWSLTMSRQTDALHVRAGQQLTHFRLHPGETVRTPRILLLFWEGADRFAGHNAFRRLMVEHYLFRREGEVVFPPVAAHDVIQGLLVPPADEQMKDLERMKRIGFETYWMDASWFPGDFRFDVGTWTPRTDLFPQGLRPIADSTHALGMKFLLWLEPERVGGMHTQIAQQHPEFLLTKKEEGWVDPENGWPGHPNEMLFDLGNEKARQWMTEFLSKRIADWGVDVLRQDRNFRPIRYWRASDAEDRQGIGENFHVQGLYRLWDELLARHPKLVIDSCNWRNTGPDIEVIKRSAGAWTRSEIADCGRLPVPNQMQVAALNLYLPVHGNGLFHLDPYHLRSVSMNGTTMALRLTELLKDGKHDDLAAKAVKEVQRLRRMTLGNFYPLSPIDLDETHFAAWQFHLPESGEGFAVFLRRQKCKHAEFVAALRDLDPQARYKVALYPTYDLLETREMSGQELTRFTARIPAIENSLLIQYRKSGS